MLQIEIPEIEFFNQKTGEFMPIKGRTLRLEHSLLSLSAWESKWKKPFLTDKEKTQEEMLDYIRCMTIDNNVDPNCYYALDLKTVNKIRDYIADPHTATTITDRRPRPVRNEIITSELIYYWMIDCGIPFECQKWHLNRLLMLIRICGIKGSPEKKMSMAAIFGQNRSLNAARRASMNSRG